MPKLKVPGESQNTKERTGKPHGPQRKRHPSKEHGSQSLADEGKMKFNGIPPRSTFYDIYGESDDEVLENWEGFSLLEIGIKEEEDDNTEEEELMETTASADTPSPLTSSSSDTPPHSPSVQSPSIPTRTGVPVRKRGVRCMQCRACLRKDDCGKCANCIDKPKFGGPGTRKQACIHRKCCNLLRDVPLKQPIKRTSEYVTLPASKKTRSDTTEKDGGSGRVVSSLFRPRRMGTVRNKVKDTPTVQLHWPDSASDYIGFPIYSVSAHHISVCVRCGSAGKEGLLTCQVCCQPFHWFCVGISGPAPSSDTPYTCSRCQFCSVCGLPDECTQCVKCQLWFHKSCLLGHASNIPSEGRERFRCVQCTKCVSCKSTVPDTVEAGFNDIVSPLQAANPVWSDGFCYCKTCFELKRKGNSCPVCGECYFDNDFDSKMVQCGRCDSWVHSHCDNLSDEDYEILSDLPDSVEYICKFCVQKEDGDKANVRWRVEITKFKKEAYEKLICQLSKSLGTLWPNDTAPPTDDPLPTVHSFIDNLNKVLEKCGKTVRTGSRQHRALYSTQQEYSKTIERLFPWYSEMYSEAGASSEQDTKPLLPNPATPTKQKPKSNQNNEDVIKKWPSEVLHDHSYIVDGSPLLAHSELEKHEEKVEENGVCEKEDSDWRYCVLCGVKGDQPPMEAGRLLPCGSVDEWIHVNCAIWSAECYEEVSGLVCNVHSAISRGQRLRCDACNQLGATVGCCCGCCSSNFHYMCARRKECVFLRNKEVYCKQHASLGEKEERVKDSEMRVDRCILVYTDLERPGRKMTRTIDPKLLRIMIGSLFVQSLGSLTSLSDTGDSSVLLPNKYSASCDFWSVVHPHKRTRYQLTIQATSPEEEELLPLTRPTEYSLAMSPKDSDWPCVSAEVGEDNYIDDGCGPWSSLSLANHAVLTPSLTQVALELLKAPDGYPVSNNLKSFKIPKRTPTKTETEKPTSVETVDPDFEMRCWEGKHESMSMSRVQFELSDTNGRKWTDTDLKNLWSTVVGELQEARRKLDLPFIPLTVDHVMRQFGLSQPLVVQLIEQLPNVEKCSRHTFRFHLPENLTSWQALRTTMNPTGCIRSEQYNGHRSTPDMFSFLMSDHRPSPPDIDSEALEAAILHAECQGNNQRQGQNDLPVAMRYRNCQKTYKDFVDVFQSRIHGLGLFCTQEIDTGDMVIEYAGTVIRSILTDKREKYYESRGIGCYMFRIDCDDVVDATMSGNMARFINHSCEPNCYSKVVSVDNQKKIMIFALRKIVPGEELTYDYKFPIEDAKIPCKCGAGRCRKTLN